MSSSVARLGVMRRAVAMLVLETDGRPSGRGVLLRCGHVIELYPGDFVVTVGELVRCMACGEMRGRRDSS